MTGADALAPIFTIVCICQHTIYYLHNIIVRSSGAEDDDHFNTRVSWQLGQAKLCFETMCHLLQLSPTNVREKCHLMLPGHQKAPSCWKPKRGPQQMGLKTRWIDAFFTETYQSAGHIKFIFLALSPNNPHLCSRLGCWQARRFVSLIPGYALQPSSFSRISGNAHANIS